MNNVRKAKEIEKIKNNIIKNFKKAEKEENKRKQMLEKEQEKEIIMENAEDDNDNLLPKTTVSTSVQKAKQTQQLKKHQQMIMKQAKHREVDEDEKRAVQYEPVTKALDKLEQTIKRGDDEIAKTMQLIPSKPKPKLTKVTFDPLVIEKQLEIEQRPKIILDEIAAKFLPAAKDDQFGIRYDKTHNSYMIGDKNITFTGNDFTIDGIKYKGNNALWLLLTSASPPDTTLYTSNDLDVYKEILWRTNAIYQNNDPVKGKVKSSQNKKYLEIIKPFWQELKEQRSTPNKKQTKPTDDLNKSFYEGSGIAKYTNDAIEYKYVDNLNEIIKRLVYINSQESAGNNNFHNEKLGLVKFVSEQLENKIDSRKGTEYLIRVVSCLPKGILKEGSGVLNNIINSLPFELHYPGYNYLGPGTKLNERLKHGSKPKNKLDEAAMEHDIFYRDNKETKERHKADEILEHKAWERVKSKDADLGEKTAAYITTNAMKLKRYFGMGMEL